MSAAEDLGPLSLQFSRGDIDVAGKSPNDTSLSTLSSVSATLALLRRPVLLQPKTVPSNYQKEQKGPGKVTQRDLAVLLVISDRFANQLTNIGTSVTLSRKGNLCAVVLRQSPSYNQSFYVECSRLGRCHLIHFFNNSV